MEKLILSITLAFVLFVGNNVYSYALSPEDEAVAKAVGAKMDALVEEMSEEYAKCGILYLKLRLADKSLTDEDEETNEFYQKSKVSFFNAWRLGDYLKKNRDDVSTPDYDIDLNNGEELVHDLTMCTAISSDPKAFFRKKVLEAGITLFDTDTLDDFINRVGLE